MQNCLVVACCIIAWFSQVGASRRENSGDSDNGALPLVIRQIIFLPLVRSGIFGLFRDLSEPSSYGVEDAINYRIPSGEGTLGAWFMWPDSGKNELSALTGNDTLVIYMHGNSRTRGFGHRVELYRLLREVGFYVLAFDYRGFGDSSKIKLSESSVVEDGLNVLNWVSQKFNQTRPNEEPLVLIWGHSLGTSIATHALTLWNNRTQGIDVSGLILESPFNNMQEEINNFWLGRMLTKALDLSSKLAAADTEFKTDKYVLEVQQPTLILHAKDDWVVPFNLGRKLYTSAKEAGKVNIRLRLHEEKHRLRHRYMYRAPGIKEDIKELWNNATEFRKDQEKSLMKQSI